MRRHLIHLIQHLDDPDAFSWTSLTCGHFFDWSLPFIHIFPEEHRSDVLDEGEYRVSFSTLSRIGEAVVRVLQRPERTANRMLFVQSFCMTQIQVVAAFEKASRRNWEVRKLDAEAFKEAEMAKADQGSLDAVEELVWYLGTVDADWTARKDFAMELLGLEDEDLQEVVDGLVGG